MSSYTAPQTMKAASSQANQQQLPQEKVAMRAYEKWCQRGCPEGTHLEDWLQAEAEIRSEQTKSGMPAQGQQQQQPSVQKAPAPMPQRAAPRR